MEVEIISKTYIKPSSTTPNHLKNHKLSLLDQVQGPIYGSIIFFYTKNLLSGHRFHTKNIDNDIGSDISMCLKESLAKTLTLFYPLAGKLRDDFSVDCDDEGACYIVARVNDSSLEEYLSRLVGLSSLNKFLPVESERFACTPGSPVTMIKETTFACGGIAIGLFLSHRVLDGLSVTSFVKSWAALARSSFEDITMPNFDSATIFPQIDPFPWKASAHALVARFMKKGKVVTRRFVFDSQAIANLKANGCSMLTKNLTRVEAVSALLIKCFMDASKARSGALRLMVSIHSIDLRRRAIPPFSQCATGNYVHTLTTLFEAGEKELGGFVYRMRKSIKKFDGDFVENLKVKDGVLKLCELTKEVESTLPQNKEFDSMGIFSWCRFGLYDIDFGWGKPLWVTRAGPNESAAQDYVNWVILLDTRNGEGIEALVSLGEEDMVMFEAHKELLAYASIDPSPLQFN